MQTTAGEARGPASGMADDGEGGGGGAGRGTANEGLRGERIWHALFDRFYRLWGLLMVSSKWAFRAHLNVVLLFRSLIKGDSSFQASGRAHRVDFFKVSVLG
jgi:hypothetical protein